MSRRKRRRGVVPTFHVVDVHALTIHCKKEVRGFRARHREALEKLRAGERDVVFPAGSYRMRVCYGAEVEEPGHDSALAREERYVELPGRVSKDELRAISETLRSISGSVDPNAEPLAERIRDGQAASVGQTEARKVEGEADEERPPSKLVPLRGRDTEDTSAAPRDAREPDRPPDEPTDR